MAAGVGRGARNKGKKGERDVISILQPVVTEVYEAHELEPPMLQRNLLQSDKGGCDLHGLEWLALEVKRQEQLNINAWWEQTVRQAGTKNEPVLFYRKNNAAWRVMLYGALRVHGTHGYWRRTVVTIDVADFLVWFRSRLSYELWKAAPTDVSGLE